MEGRAKIKGVGEFTFDTMDLTTAVLTGLIAIALTYYFGFMDHLLRVLGPVGVVGASAVLWSWFYVPQAIATYLRRKWIVYFIAAYVAMFIRWFLGDPDGPFLLGFGTLIGVFGVVIGTLLSRGYSDKLYWWFIYGWLGGFGDAVGMYVMYGGLNLYGNSWLIWFLGAGVLASVAWGILWVVGRLIGAQLVKSGVNRPS